MYIIYSIPINNSAQRRQEKIAQSEAEDAGGLTPVKDDNEAMCDLNCQTVLNYLLDCYNLVLSL